MAGALLRCLLLFLVASAPSVARTVHKNCTWFDTWDNETSSFDLSGCIGFNATGIVVNVTALSLALRTTGAEMMSLRLVSNGIDEDGAQTLADALESHTSITNLHMHMNDLSSTGATAIARALHDNVALTRLTLSRCNIRDLGAVAVSEMLRINGVITSVDLEYNDIATPGIAAISGALQENNVLQSLKIGINPIFPAGAAQLAKALRKNTALKELNVRYSGVQDGGMVALSQALQENRVLRDLDVWFNAIGDPGVAAIGHALKANDALTRLNLWDNNISDVGIESLAAGLLAGNSQLESLHLGRNEEVGDASVVHLQRVMYENEALTFIDFGVGNTQVGPTFEAPLMKACRCNKLLQEDMKTLWADYGKLESSRTAAAQCRKEALAKVPMRVSIKEMLKSQGLDPATRKANLKKQADEMDRLVKEYQKLPPDQQAELKRMLREVQEKNKRKANETGQPRQEEVKVKVNSPHQEHLNKLKKAKADDSDKAQADTEAVDRAFGKTAHKTASSDERGHPEQTPRKKRRATRQQQEERRKKKQAEAKDEV